MSNKLMKGGEELRTSDLGGLDVVQGVHGDGAGDHEWP
jgi:hypothetical protein